MRWLWRMLRQQDKIAQLEQTIGNLRHNVEYQREELRKRNLYNFPLGTRIMVIPNHPCELIIGSVVGHEEICASRQVVPLFFKRCDCGEWDWTEVSNGCFCRSCGVQKVAEMTHNPSYWNETLEAVIKDLPWWQRWNVVHPNGHHTYTKEKAEHLEQHGSLCDFPEEV